MDGGFCRIKTVGDLRTVLDGIDDSVKVEMEESGACIGIRFGVIQFSDSRFSVPMAWIIEDDV